MKSHIFRYIFFVSLILNFSFLGAAGYTHYHQPHSTAPTGSGIRGRTPPGSPPKSHIFEALSLKPDQLELFRNKAVQFHETLDKKRTTVADLNISLLGLMREDDTDLKAIEAVIADINEVQQDMQEIVISHMLEFKSMLDKDQQKRFLDLIQRAITETGEMGCP